MDSLNFAQHKFAFCLPSQPAFLPPVCLPLPENQLVYEEVLEHVLLLFGQLLPLIHLRSVPFRFAQTARLRGKQPGVEAAEEGRANQRVESATPGLGQQAVAQFPVELVLLPVEVVTLRAVQRTFGQILLETALAASIFWNESNEQNHLHPLQFNSHL